MYMMFLTFISKHCTQIVNTVLCLMHVHFYSLKYSAPVTKFDRHGYKSRKRVMVLTDKHLYLLDEKSYLLKDKVPYQQITGWIVFLF